LPPRRRRPAGLRHIAEAWGLTVAEQLKLLGIARAPRSSSGAANATALPQDTLERLSYLLGIYKSLQILLPDPRAADDGCASRTAPPFGGRSALERMLSGQVADLYVVRAIPRRRARLTRARMPGMVTHSITARAVRFAPCHRIVASRCRPFTCSSASPTLPDWERSTSWNP
jgi:hypothetical protein